MRIWSRNTAAILPFSSRHFVECRVDFPPLVKGGPGGVVNVQSGTFLPMLS
jgi:hypothetical protein